MQNLTCLLYKHHDVTYPQVVQDSDCPMTYNHEFSCPKLTYVLCPINYYCISTWTYNMMDGNQSKPTLMHSYCMDYNSPTICNSKCIPNFRATSATYHCCCNSSKCNENPTHFQKVTQNSTHIDKQPSDDIPIDSRTILALSAGSTGTILLISLLFLILALISGFIVYKWRESRVIAKECQDLLSLSATNTQRSPKPDGDSTHNKNQLDHNIVLYELVGYGRFAEVRRAFMSNSEEVAVKIIGFKDRQIFNNELRVLELLKEKRHDNVIRFIQAQERSSATYSNNEDIEDAALDDNQQRKPQNLGSCWLVVEFCRHGSLYNFLIDNDDQVRILSWKVLYDLIIDIVNGLKFLHDNNIVHCDFKSKNVLLKGSSRNPIACITDFGHSIILDESFDKPCDKRHKYLQVGTPRYMAPEILECSVIFARSSFPKIDVYSLGLVMWELLTRLILPPYYDDNNQEVQVEEYLCCKMVKLEDVQGSTVGPYRMPYQESAPAQPTIEQMCKIVVEDRETPKLKTEWEKSPLISKITGCIKDALDYDHDARVSSSCIAARLRYIPSNNLS